MQKGVYFKTTQEYPKMVISDNTWKTLIEAAKSAGDSAYVPYSKFPVGAAVLTDNGEIVSGCNVENASYGLTMCAERNAVFQAVAKGHRKIKALVIYTPTAITTMPCGACRQVMQEFGADAEVLSVCNGRDSMHSDMSKLLPEAFGPDNL
ncbi:MAG: cytidine deaminase [Burkholderiales bacterium]